VLFNSYEFIFVFLPVTLTGFLLTINRAGRVAALSWLLIASVVFYGYASFSSLLIVIPSILLDYLIARAYLSIAPTRDRLRGRLIAFGITANVLLLGYFKYRNFFLDTANITLGTHFELSRMLLPIGLSFLTFQKIAFLADVHSGKIKAVSLLEYLLFACFFPRTLAGPIVHYQEIVPQFKTLGSQVHASNLAVGLCLFSIGLFKKTVIADGIAQFVPAVFEPNPDYFVRDIPHTLVTSWIGALCYTFQLYFDFSGYSDMALGTARMVGIQLPMNFNSPYKASSIIEYWGRWHITLTRFLTWYIYVPIGRRLARYRIARGKQVLRGRGSSFPAIASLIGIPTMITMLVSGLWHGAGWRFVIWGLLHGVYLTVNHVWRQRQRMSRHSSVYSRIESAIGQILTFGSVVIALVFFRANSVSTALSILAGMASLNGILPSSVQLFQSVGGTLSWDLFWRIVPPPALEWILVLSLAVIMLPNSLEMLRGFHPAGDFPPAAQTSPAGSNAPSRGLGPSVPTAIAVALLFVVGVFAITRGNDFLYGQF
jgi:alginate O-acetyltransferase complex protein AlgI